VKVPIAAVETLQNATAAALREQPDGGLRASVPRVWPPGARAARGAGV